MPLSRDEMPPFSPDAGSGADTVKCTELLLAPACG